MLAISPLAGGRRYCLSAAPAPPCGDVMTDQRIRLGFLYPDHSAEDDYPRIGARIRPAVAVEVVHTSIGEDAHREDALRDTGEVRRLLEGASTLRQRGVDA